MAFNTFDIPASPQKEVITIEKLRGCDLTSPPSCVTVDRSPNCPNMIRDIPGKVRKRMGYFLKKKFTDRINGVYTLKLSDSEKILIHSGTKLYLTDFLNEPILLYSDMADIRAKAWQIKGKLYILDGKKYLVYGEFDNPDYTEGGTQEKKTYQIKAVSDIAYVPLIIISRLPVGDSDETSGGGTTYEPINLLSKRWKESFYGSETGKQYQLTTTKLDADEPVTAKILQSDGTWKEYKENSGFTVNRTTGMVTFTTAPGKTPAYGTDNVIIEAGKTREGYIDKINKCMVSVLYGVGGNADRLFVTGNPEFKNYDWYSQMNDPTFFGDTWYCTIGQDSSAIVGYSVISNCLATHKDEGEDGRNIIIRNGVLGTDGKKATFPIVNTIQGAGALGSHTFCYMNEPLFATKQGVFAITAADITAEKYAQNRSYYINGALTEENLSDAFGMVFNEYYILATDKRMYLLDSNQKIYENKAPYSTFQYETYYFEIPNIRIMFKYDEGICLGMNDGSVFEFYKDKENQKSYNDNGLPIKCRWDLPDIYGEYFYKNKTFRFMSIVLSSAIVTGAYVWIQKHGIWTNLFDTGAKAVYWDFSYINFAKINFSCDKTPRTIGKKIKVKKIDKARFSIRNEELNEPFGIYEIAFEYTQNGNFKG